MAPALKNIVEAAVVCCKTSSDIPCEENTTTPSTERIAMFLDDVFFDKIVNVTLRRAPGTHFLISKCGRFVMNDKFPHITKIYHATDIVRETYQYLNIERVKIHILVGLAWVYNPMPLIFTCMDHIDGDRMNNHAWNLRWITTALNAQNRHGGKYYRGPKFGNGGVYFQSYIIREGKELVLKTHGSRKDATAYGIKMRMLKFNEEYHAHLAHDGETGGPRHNYMFLWTDPTVEVSTNNNETMSRIRRITSRRSSHFTL